MDIGTLLAGLPVGILLDHTAIDADSSSLVNRIEFYEGQPVETPGAAVLLSLPDMDQPHTVRALEPLHSAALLVLPHNTDPQALEDLRRFWEQRGLPVPVTARKSRWVGWGELHLLLTGVLQPPALTPHLPLAHESLSGLADYLMEQSAASITIEDLSSRVLAYSSTDAPVDRLRADTIVQRAIPPWRVHELMADGFLPAVWRAEDVVERENSDGGPARLVVPIRTGDSTVGTIWAAPADETDTDRLKQLLREAAAIAAPLFVRDQVTVNLDAHLQEQALRSLLGGEGDLRAAAALLGLPSDGRFVVMAYEALNGAELRTIEFHLAAALPGFRAVTRTQRDRRYRVLLADMQGISTPDVHDGSPTRESTESLLADSVRRHLDRTLPSGTNVRAVLVTGITELTKLSEGAAEVQLGLQALRIGATEPKSQPASRSTVVSASSLADAIEVLRLVTSDGIHAEQLCRPIDDLLRHDREHGTDLVTTLRAALTSYGNTSSAARSLNIHSNSLRYRLSRIREVAGIDLGAPASRLRAELALVARDLMT